MRLPASQRKIPHRFHEVVETIWNHCGPYEFLYNSISAKITNGPGIMRRMSNDGIIIDGGRVMASNRSANTRKWQLSPEYCQICTNLFGPAPADAAQISAESIQGYKDHINSYIRYVPANDLTENIPEMKICSRCKKEHPIEDFQCKHHTFSGIKIRMRNICRECRNKQKRDKRAEEKQNPKPKLPAKILRKHENVIGEIWRIVGPNPFMWSTISGKEGHFTRMTLPSLRLNDVVIDLGWVLPYQKTRVWQFNPTITQAIKRYYGPANPNAEKVCRASIDLFKKDIRDYCAKKSAVRYERLSSQAVTA